jgi:hypothetical protein
MKPSDFRTVAMNHINTKIDLTDLSRKEYEFIEDNKKWSIIRDTWDRAYKWLELHITVSIMEGNYNKGQYIYFVYKNKEGAYGKQGVLYEGYRFHRVKHCNSY